MLLFKFSISWGIVTCNVPFQIRVNVNLPHNNIIILYIILTIKVILFLCHENYL